MSTKRFQNVSVSLQDDLRALYDSVSRQYDEWIRKEHSELLDRFLAKA